MTSREGMLAGRNPDDLDRAERRELISAYLDDELPTHEARQVTRWLDENPGALTEVEHLRRTWDLLDHYEDEVVPDGFAQRVLSAVGLKRPEGRPGRVVQMAWYRRPQTLMAAAAVMLVAFGLLFQLRDDPTRIITPAVPGSVAVIEEVPEDLLLHLDQLTDLEDDAVDSVIATGADVGLGG